MDPNAPATHAVTLYVVLAVLIFDTLVAAFTAWASHLHPGAVLALNLFALLVLLGSEHTRRHLQRVADASTATPTA